MQKFNEWVKTKTLKDLAKKAGIDFDKYDPKEIEIGMKEELEHGKRDPKLNVTNNDPLKTLKIVLAHLDEDAKYYTKLKKAMP